MRNVVAYLSTFLVFTLFGPIIGTFVFFWYFGINAANEMLLPFAFISGAFIGIMPAALCGLLFYPIYIAIKILNIDNSRIRDDMLGLLIGSTLGALSLLLFFYLAGNITYQGLVVGVSHLLMPLLLVMPGGTLGFISTKIIVAVKGPDKRNQSRLS
jgi:hypothetical protein